jgi:hypothetical protein
MRVWRTRAARLNAAVVASLLTTAMSCGRTQSGPGRTSERASVRDASAFVEERGRDEPDAAPTARAAEIAEAGITDADPTYRFPLVVYSPAPTPAQAVRLFDTPVRVILPGESVVRTVSNCEELLSLPLSDELSTVPSNELERVGLWSIAVDCKALRMLAGAEGANDSYVGELLTSDTPARLLPPQLGLVDFDVVREAAEAAAAQCHSWRTFDKDVRLKKDLERRRFEIQAGDWSGWLYILARGDFDGDSFEDILVRRDGKANEGSWSATALYLLSRTQNDRCIRVAQTLGLS